jgi:hypothetical protein
MVGMVLAVVAGRWLTRLTRTGELVRQVDEMSEAVLAWQFDHRARVRGLERRMTDIEVSVHCAEEDAHAAAVQMRSIDRDLLRRIEEFEQRWEIQMLVDQGRIPRDHLP